MVGRGLLGVMTWLIVDHQGGICGFIWHNSGGEFYWFHEPADFLALY